MVWFFLTRYWGGVDGGRNWGGVWGNFGGIIKIFNYNFIILKNEEKYFKK